MIEAGESSLESFSVFSSQVGGYLTNQQEFIISQVEAQQVSIQLL